MNGLQEEEKKNTKVSSSHFFVITEGISPGEIQRYVGVKIARDTPGRSYGGDAKNKK